MRAVVIKEPYTVECVDKPMPRIGPRDLLIKVIRAGICGSDKQRVSEGLDKHKNKTIGHEIVGLVADKGLECEEYAVGDRAVVIPLIPCGACINCKRGLYSLCRNYSFIGSRRDGGIADYVAVPKENAMKIPPSVTDDEAVFLEPITVAMHALLGSKNIIGSQVIINGCGTIGLLALQLYRIAGAMSIAAVDVAEEKLRLAKELGADIAVNASSENGFATLADFLGHGLDSIVVESSGVVTGASRLIDISLPRGQILLIGTTKSDVILPSAEYSQILRKELTIQGCWMNYSAPFPGKEWFESMNLLEKHSIKVGALISEKYPLEDAKKAFASLYEMEKSPIKVLFAVD